MLLDKVFMVLVLFIQEVFLVLLVRVSCSIFSPSLGLRGCIHGFLSLNELAGAKIDV